MTMGRKAARHPMHSGNGLDGSSSSSSSSSTSSSAGVCCSSSSSSRRRRRCVMVVAFVGGCLRGSAGYLTASTSSFSSSSIVSFSSSSSSSLSSSAKGHRAGVWTSQFTVPTLSSLTTRVATEWLGQRKRPLASSSNTSGDDGNNSDRMKISDADLDAEDMPRRGTRAGSDVRRMTVDVEEEMMDHKSRKEMQEQLDIIAAIREHSRIYQQEARLADILGHSASVGDWAEAAGYRTANAMSVALQTGQRAKDKLTKTHIAMIKYFAGKYAKMTQSMSFDDLMQEGNMGLLDAVDHFDPSRGLKFQTYASYRVKGAILRAIANKDRIIRLPVNIQDDAAKIRHVEKEIMKLENLSQKPSTEAVAKALGVTVAKVQQNKQAMVKNPIVSGMTWGNSKWSQAVSNSDASSRSVETATGRSIFVRQRPVNSGLSGLMSESSIIQEDIWQVLATHLAPREMQILCLRFGLNHIGTVNGINSNSGGDGNNDSWTTAAAAAAATASSGNGVGGGSSSSIGGGNHKRLIPRTHKEIGEMMNASAEGIRRSILRSLQKLRDNSAALDALGDLYLEIA